MRKIAAFGFFCLCLMFGDVLGTARALAADKFITIGTGGVTGVYYPAGGAICRLLNRGRKEHGIRCSVESTGGSIYNLNALRQGDIEIGIAESGWQYQAMTGQGYFEQLGSDHKLRSLFSLHNEPFTIVARADSGIQKVDELVGKRVNIGNPGSGIRANMEVLMKRKRWTAATFKTASELKPAELAKALCDNQIDAFVYVAGHPNAAIQEASANCPIKLVGFDQDEVEGIVKANPFYVAATIPGGMYAGNPENIATFSAKATVVSSESVDPEVIYQLVRAVFENFDNFRTLHPIFSTLDKKEMASQGLSAPLHPGAMKYYKEAGLIP
ncbi:MAG: TAXI family TRAP transporter solute-binding subunit [Alphaproteobacteria bacterium]|nr:TAXI family TRAP transporter solute-binding subunit [Alphaproteobacteria bacterium]